VLARHGWSAAVLCCSFLLVCTDKPAHTQDEKLSGFDRNRAKIMLKIVADDIKSNYYDPTLHGFDLKSRFEEAKNKINSASTFNYALADIGGAVTDLNDSHTFFIPPPRPYTHAYGWRVQPIGDSDCFITAVRPDSDAAAKGVKPGDQVISINGYAAIREDMWKLHYVFDQLRPQPGLRMVLRSPDGTVRQVDAMARMQARKRLLDITDVWSMVRDEENAEYLNRDRWAEFGKTAIILKLPVFTFDPSHADAMLDKIRTHDVLILDVRGNPGGYVESLSRLLGGMFEHDVKIADRVSRKGTKPQIAKTRGEKTFRGKLVVLVDSGSASASEVFARVVQLEKRGMVVGDRSSGSVMESRIYPHEVGLSVAAFYATSITDANLIMSDGRSIEHVGVMPDERVLPSATDLAAGRDPALARAAALAGVELTPEAAGKLFPVEWPK